MCIAFFVWTEDRFLVCHNRDEFLSRSTTDTHWWPKQRNNENEFEILAPRDDVSGGSWFGFERTTGRCAFLTNIREKDSTLYPSSRGELIGKYLTSDPTVSALEYLRNEMSGRKVKDYAGFNLVVFSGRDLAYVSSRGRTNGEAPAAPISLEKDTEYGLSNSLLAEPYNKVRKGLGHFRKILTQSHQRVKNSNDEGICLWKDLKELMHRKQAFPGDPLPRTGQPGFPAAIVEHLSSIFVPHKNNYGTRTTICLFLYKRKESCGPGNNDQCCHPLNKISSFQWIEKNWNPVTFDWETKIIQR